ncbi:MAG: hypothetical protein IJ051_03540 [Clostridia bacterium]|nr:hypothetical protein [Clostridia bacterium]
MKRPLFLWRCTAFVLLLTLSLALAGCSKMENVTLSPKVDPSDEASYSAGAADADEGVLSSGETVQYYVPLERKNPGDREVTLFIWNVDSWRTVQWQYRDNLTAQKLLEGLAYVTNWNLSTTAVKVEKESIAIWWDKNASLYTGLPEKQAKDYMVFEQRDLDAAILDSIKQTITENLGPSYSIYYAASDGTDLLLPDVNVTITSAAPYSRFADY